MICVYVSVVTQYVTMYTCHHHLSKPRVQLLGMGFLPCALCPEIKCRLQACRASTFTLSHLASLSFSDIYLFVQKVALKMFRELSSLTLGAYPMSLCKSESQSNPPKPEDTRKAQKILALVKLSTLIPSHLSAP